MRRLRELRQVKAADCGAACLAMVLTHHGRPATVRQVTADLGVSRDGLSAHALVAAAERYGLRARAFSLPPEGLAAVPTPAVLYWNFNHFVLLERWGPRRVRLLDPVSGRRRLGPDEFAAGFTGVVIGFEPCPDFRPGRAPEPPAWRRRFLTAALRNYRPVLAQVLLASLLLQLLGLAVPALSAVLVDRLLPTGATGLLAPLGIAVAVAVAAQAVLGFLRTGLLLTLRTRADHDVTGGVVRHLFALPFRFFADRGTGELVMRTHSVTALREILSGHVLATLLDAPLALGYLGLVLWRDPVFGGCLAALGCVQLVLLLCTRRRVAELAERELYASGKAQAQLIEALGGIETLKAAGAEERAVQRWSHLQAAQLNAGLRHGLLRGGLETALGALQYLAPAALLLVGAHRVLHGDLSLGTMLALGALATAALAPLSSIVDNLQQLQQTGAHLARLDDIMAEEPETTTAQAVPVLDGRVEVRDLGFRFDPRAPWVLRGVTFSVEPGQKVAFVGRSGSGKSTLARLLLGLYHPTEGQVRHGGHDAATIDPHALRRQFGVVTQDPALFTGTVRENIGLTDPDAPLSRIAAAAATAAVHEEIMAMPMGYDTVLVDGGGVSGGQRQRIALARALLGEPRLLLLDEATSHLDPATEAVVEERLAALPQTRIVIAHRLSTVRDADVIYVLHEGRIVEHGGHAELLARGGHYADLTALQAAV
ncbi:peptidase domain-containing ABC transporter [Dactylosporangium sp. NPDC049525]|uniref:peptidase domain-containing ABC transporter n=1 Tax=Dactylosporangium sp. NPDC049525 TaxID=3154730 RepID=UPI003435D254